MLATVFRRDCRLASSSFLSSSSFSSMPVVELREYLLKPEAVGTYMKATTAAADLRKSLVPMRLFSTPDTGGRLNKAIHFYHYEGGIEERDEKRCIQAKNKEWAEYLKQARPCMKEQKSNIYAEAPFVHSDPRIPGFKAEFYNNSITNPNCIYEMRRYQLKLGYDTVPRFLKLYSGGLDSKLEAKGTCPSTSLCTVLYTEIGSLNEVIEIWRHGEGVNAMTQSRNAARSADAWRDAIKNIADLANSFTNTIVRPADFSSWK